MEKIAFEQITKTYNGKRGCACGCNGTYTLPSHVSIADANREIGYDGYDETSVSDRRATVALRKINTAIEKFGPLAEKTDAGTTFEAFEYRGVDDDGKAVWFCYSNSFVAIDRGDRATTVHFQK